MAFLDTTKANIAYKQVLGKIHTNNNRESFNEPESTLPITLGQFAWADKVHPTTPGDSSNSGIVSSLLTFDLVAVSGTDGTGVPSSYYCKLGAVVPSDLVGKINPRTGAAYAAYDRVGNFIPASVHSNYRPKLFKNSTETTPLDASDWFVDCFAGVVTQETDVPASMINYSTGSTVQAYVYIGKTISDAIIAAGSNIIFYDKKTVGNGITGVVDGSNVIFTLAATPDSGSEHIYINGVLQNAGGSNDYTISGSTITFASAIRVEDTLMVSYRATI